jgi:hypothetical protein
LFSCCSILTPIAWYITTWTCITHFLSKSSMICVMYFRGIFSLNLQIFTMPYFSSLLHLSSELSQALFCFL